jgi:hypothetical protein
MLHAGYLMLKNSLWPRILGGVPREYIYVQGFADLQRMERLRQLVEEGKLRVAVDSCWEMENVLRVSNHRIIVLKWWITELIIKT